MKTAASEEEIENLKGKATAEPTVPAAYKLTTTKNGKKNSYIQEWSSVEFKNEP